jgi:phospholipase/lecithinase/hemolysin
MKMNAFPILLFIVFLFAPLLSTNAHAQKIDELIIFGDSLSDTGNLSSVTTDFPFPFYQNRISNGPVIVDFLASELGVNANASEHTSNPSGGNNFAIAGGNVIGNDVEDLTSQVTAYLQRNQRIANDQALFFVMMGGNDLRDIRSISSSATASVRINEVRDHMLLELNRLYDAGARVFLVANVANIGRIPETLSRVQDDPNISVRAEQYVRLYNQRLSTALSDFSNKPNVSIREFNLFTELESLLANSVTLGFTQTEVGCFTLDEFDFHPDCLFGTRFDRFVFFDNLHPSAKTNAIIGAKIVNYIPEFPTNRPKRLIITPILDLLLSD